MIPFDKTDELDCYRNLFRNTCDGYVLTNVKGRILDANPAFCTMLGLTREELGAVGSMDDLYCSDRRINEYSLTAEESKTEEGGPEFFEKEFSRKDGSVFPAEIVIYAVSDEPGQMDNRWIRVRDITEKKRVDVYHRLSLRIFEILNETSDFKKTCDDIIKNVIEFTGCAAAGIRLHQGDDFPFFSHDGFSQSFLLSENSLTIRRPDGGVCRDDDGEILLECTCGLVISGKTDPSNPMFTPGGSCWTNNSLPLIDTKDDKDTRLNPRNRCIHEGFASVAIVPIKTGQKIVGLLQINDRRKDRFSLPVIQILESIAAHIGGALGRKESEWRFHELFRKSGSGIAVYQVKNNGNDFVFKDMNKAGEVLSKVKREDILGRNLLDVFPSVKEFGLLDALRRVWETGEAESLPLSLYKDDRIAQYVKNEIFRLPSGEVVAVYEDLSEIKKAEEKLNLAYSELEKRVEERTRELSAANEYLHREIAERKKTESNLRRSRTLFSAIAEGTSDAVYVKDTQSRYMMVNSASADIMGKSVEDIIGKTDKDLFPEEIAVSLVQGDRIIIETGETRTFEEMVRVKGTEDKVFLSTKGPIWNEDGNIAAVFGISRDITGRAMMEKEREELAARQRKIQKAESLRRMAAAIAHKFNNMMGVVIGNIELALDSGNSGKERDGFMKEADTAARKAADVSGLMLTYLGQISGPQEVINLSEACRLNYDLISAPLPETMELTLDLSSNETPIKANAYQIQQVIVNLVTNALESYSHGKGNIRLGVKTVSEDSIPQVNRFPADWQPQAGDYICLEVADQGCGIPEENFENLFDPFFTSKFTGRGLGLPVVLGIVSAHKGTVTVESTVGKGSIFRIYLPKCESGEYPPAVRSTHCHPFAGKISILIVEDENRLRKMAADMLTRMGFSVITAKDGIEALELFKRNDSVIDCVFSDLTMPGMDGWETLEAIRKLDPDVPVVLTSGYDQGTVMEGHPSDPPDGFIRKPYRMVQLRETLCQVLEKKRRLH